VIQENQLLILRLSKKKSRMRRLKRTKRMKKKKRPAKNAAMERKIAANAIKIGERNAVKENGGRNVVVIVLENGTR
jgi:hypothetical protein